MISKYQSVFVLIPETHKTLWNTQQQTAVVDWEALKRTWMAPVSSRRVVQDDDAGHVVVYYRQVFNITT